METRILWVQSQISSSIGTSNSHKRKNYLKKKKKKLQAETPEQLHSSAGPKHFIISEISLGLLEVMAW